MSRSVFESSIVEVQIILWKDYNHFLNFFFFVYFFFKELSFYIIIILKLININFKKTETTDNDLEFLFDCNTLNRKIYFRTVAVLVLNIF